MIRSLLGVFAIAVASFTVIAQPAIPQNLESAVVVPVHEIVSMTENEAFCLAEDWTGGFNQSRPNGVVPILEPKFRRLFSKQFFTLFMWIQCGKPRDFRTINTERSYYWDFRYGIPEKSSKGDITNIRVLPPKQIKMDVASVTVLYDWGSKKNLSTRYTLIREDQQWKIDDIALKGYNTEAEEILPGSKSLKTELQAAYKRAEAKYQKDKQTLRQK